MKFLILGENCFVKLSPLDKSIFSTFSVITSIYARQIAAVTPKPHIVKVLEGREEIDYDEECDVVHIHFKTGTAIRAYEIADAYRDHGKVVVLSGAHTSALPKEAQEHADSVLVGSAELLWPRLVCDLERGNLQPFYESKGQLKKEVATSDAIDLPIGVKMIGIIEATRGCPYQCDFCQESNVASGSSFRIRPVDEVIAEIRSLPQRLLFFCDASLTIDVAYSKELFSRMKGLHKHFFCEGNADVLARDVELVRLSSEAGCMEWTVGLESFSQQTLDGVGKKTNAIEDFTRVVQNIHRYRMAVLGNFIFGFDQDTPDIFNLAYEQIMKMGLDSARFAVLTPYPGTPLFDRLDSEGRILTRDWSKYTRKNVVFEPKNMTKAELEHGFFMISHKFNALPNVISRDVRSLRLGVYPFIASIGRNFESYLNRPGKSMS